MQSFNRFDGFCGVNPLFLGGLQLTSNNCNITIASSFILAQLYDNNSLSYYFNLIIPIDKKVSKNRTIISNDNV